MAAAFVVIVNFRTGGLVVDCLASLKNDVGALRGGRVIVVDNASGDDSVQRIGGAIDGCGWAAWAELVALPRNGGFAYGNNRAIERVRRLDPTFGTIVFLNPDAMVRPGSLALLLQHLDEHADAGIVGASLEDERGRRQRSAHVFPTPLSELDSAAQFGPLSRLIGARALAIESSSGPCRCDWVSGACFAARRQLLDQIGLLDEGYFLYFEETEFCWRARQAGWSCWFVPDCRVVHIEGSSTGIRDPERRRPAYWFASRRRFFAKVHGVAGLIMADCLWALGRASLILRRFFRLGGAYRGQPEPRRFLVDMVLGDIKAVAKGDLRRLAVVTESSP